MPVTAKFSKEFYDKLGHNVADELVDWFNTVDATYRSDFKGLFDAHFGRLDAKLEQRVAELRAYVDTRFAALESKLEQQVTELRAYVDARFAAQDSKLEQRLGRLETRMIRWMFVFWAGTVGTLLALL